MRRRDRYANLTWFAGWADDPQSRRLATRHPPVEGISQMVARITGSWGYFMEITPDVERIEVRLFPHRPWNGLGTPRLSFLYSGSSLGSILAAALTELGMVKAGARTYEISTKEVERWVP